MTLCWKLEIGDWFTDDVFLFASIVERYQVHLLKYSAEVQNIYPT